MEWVSFEEIKRRVRIAGLLRHYGVEGLRRSGRDQMRGRCPIHRGEGKDAFQVNVARDVFHCFACGAGGNVLDLVAAMEGCALREAALKLKSRYAWGDELAAEKDAGLRRRENQLVTKKREVNRPLNFSLQLDGADVYLSERGLEFATVSYFGVGYFAGGGLMTGRIVIPIHDETGRLVAYCGRALNNAVPRYLFPAGFAKSQVLFNYHRALGWGREEVVVVEGFFDCMRLHQAGYRCVVALMGSVLSVAQKELLVQCFGRIVLMLDGDRAGRAASERIASELRRECAVREVLLEPGRQPDQLTKDEIGWYLTEPGIRRAADGRG